MTFNLDELKLSTAPAAYANFLAKAADDDTAMVAAGQATGFLAGIKNQTKRDVMNSNLLAQLAASAKYDRFKQASEWYNEYKYILENIGWQVVSFKFEKRYLRDTPISVDKVVLDFLKDSLDAAQLSLVNRIIFALEKSNDIAVEIFIRSSTADNHAHFQLGTCTEYDSKNPVLSLGGFSYSTSEPIVNPLYTVIKKGDTEFDYAFLNAILNLNIYATIRDAIIDKLGYQAQNLIHDLVLPPKN